MEFEKKDMQRARMIDRREVCRGRIKLNSFYCLEDVGRGGVIITNIYEFIAKNNRKNNKK